METCSKQYVHSKYEALSSWWHSRPLRTGFDCLEGAHVQFPSEYIPEISKSCDAPQEHQATLQPRVEWVYAFDFSSFNFMPNVFLFFFFCQVVPSYCKKSLASVCQITWNVWGSINEGVQCYYNKTFKLFLFPENFRVLNAPNMKLTG